MQNVSVYASTPADRAAERILDGFSVTRRFRASLEKAGPAAEQGRLSPVDRAVLLQLRQLVSHGALDALEDANAFHRENRAALQRLVDETSLRRRQCSAIRFRLTDRGEYWAEVLEPLALEVCSYS